METYIKKGEPIPEYAKGPVGIIDKLELDGPYRVVEWFWVGDLYKKFFVGWEDKDKTFPWKYYIIEEDYDMQGFWALRGDIYNWQTSRMVEDSIKLMYCLKAFSRKILMTLAVWGLADYHAYNRTTWKHNFFKYWLNKFNRRGFLWK